MSSTQRLQDKTASSAATRQTRNPGSPNEPAIRLNGIEKWYETGDGVVHALAATDLVIRDGEFVVLLGPSGCGKTTLLRMIGGLIARAAGNYK